MRNDETLDAAKEHLYLIIGYWGENLSRKPAAILGEPPHGTG